MAMKKIKPQYGKVVPPVVSAVQNTDDPANESAKEKSEGISAKKTEKREVKSENNESNTEIKLAINDFGENESSQESLTAKSNDKSGLLSEPNPFLQTKEIFGKARLTKVGYRVRTDFVEVLDIIKKMKKNGYTLEAVLDDALSFYFENSEDGRQAIKKAEIFYS